MKDYKHLLKQPSKLIASGLLAAAVSTPAAAEDFEMSVSALRTSLSFSTPDADDNWDGNLGIQLQGLFSTNALPEEYKIGLFFGTTTWDANNDTVTLTNSNALSAQLSGESQITQLGASVLLEKSLPNNLSATLETGVQYQIISSDANITFTYSGGSTVSEKLDLDNNMAVIMGADINKKFQENLSAYIGATYQFAFITGDASAAGSEVDNSTDAFSVRAGIQFTFD